MADTPLGTLLRKQEGLQRCAAMRPSLWMTK